MAIKNTELGGTDWVDGEILYAIDMNDTVDKVGYVPVGAILAWNKSLTGTPSLLSDRFVECNGQTLSDASSPLNGQVIPDLNGSSGTERFLRGQTTSGGTGGSETHTHSVSATSVDGDPATDSVGNNGNTTATSTLPTYYEVVFIMRVK